MYLVKACLSSLYSLITDIIHSSLVSGIVQADSSNFNHFHPISNLLFLSKILEWIVAAQVWDHLSVNSLYKQFQSGFYPYHSVLCPQRSVRLDFKSPFYLNHWYPSDCVLILFYGSYSVYSWSSFKAFIRQYRCSAGLNFGSSFIFYSSFSSIFPLRLFSGY